MIDILLIVLGAFFIVAGFIGSILPVLPGPPLSYTGLLILQLTSGHPFSAAFLLLWLVITVILAVLDNVIPAWGTKRFGGTAYGVWGSMIGLVAGIFFPPAGLLIGPIAGAFAGELAGGSNANNALRSAWGSFVGVLFGTVLNIVAAGMMGYYFLVNL